MTSARISYMDMPYHRVVCVICGSKLHWARNCQHAYDRQQSLYSSQECYEEEEVQVTLLAEGSESSNMDILLGETIGCVLLDSGCSKTVCGTQWFQCFIETLSAVQINSVQYMKSSSVYRFGDGNRVTAVKAVNFPCILAGKAIRIHADIVECNIPLLLSRSSMKKAGMVIDLNNDVVTVFNKDLKLGLTSLGHYILPIYRCLTPDNIESVLSVSAVHSNKRAIAEKLHKQFAHPSSEKLIKLMKDAGRNDGELFNLVNDVTSGCEVCSKYKRQRPRPVVSLPLATAFNETVAMDLKTWKDKYFFVMVDLHTRFCRAVVINNKLASTISTNFLCEWISLFGAPKKILSDNGLEFGNETMRELTGNFGITILNTKAAESPWSNGVCERLNCVLGISVQKLTEDTKCDVTTALAWSVAARNALHNNHGFSPNQLVFGYNPSIPNICDRNPVMLEARSNQQIVVDNMNAMTEARAEFIKNESNERIRRALLHQTRVTDVEDLVNGDSVYYKRQDDDKWRGPAIVIGRDGKQILVRHGSIYVRVHSCRLQHTPSSSINLDINDNIEKTEMSKHEDQNVIIESEDENIPEENTPPIRQRQRQQMEDGHRYISPSRKSSKPKLGSTIECISKETGDVFKVKILNRAGKAGGIYDSCYNVKRESGEKDWIDLARQVEKWRPVEDSEILLTASADNSDDREHLQGKNKGN